MAGRAVATPGPTGRNFEARISLETACQNLATRMNERMPYHVPFTHGGQQGAVTCDPRRAPAVNMRLGAESHALTVSPLAEISFRGTPIARLQGAELQAANELANAALQGLERHKPAHQRLTLF